MMDITDYQFRGIPIFIYGMIGITTLVLAYATLLDDNDSSSESDVKETKTPSPVKEDPPREELTPEAPQPKTDDQEEIREDTTPEAPPTPPRPGATQGAIQGATQGAGLLKKRSTKSNKKPQRRTKKTNQAKQN